METKQPNWKLLAQLGDVHPIEYGGYFVYEDQTGVYEAEAELLISPDSDEQEQTIGWQVYRFELEKLKIASDSEGNSYLVPAKYSETWMHPLADYKVWFADSLANIASSLGSSESELREMLCSDDPRVRAEAYKSVGEYHGFDNLDSYPLHFKDRAEVEERYNPRVETKLECPLCAHVFTATAADNEIVRCPKCDREILPA